MSPNDDFSFVRFLKVVKTLYESSTFTQLGRTVGSALNPSHGMASPSTDDEETFAKLDRQKQVGESEDEKNIDATKSTNTLLNVLAFCTSPQNTIGDEKRKRNKERKTKSPEGDSMTLDTRDTRNQSLLEQVLNCTFAQGDDPFSDDDTYQTKDERSYGSQTHDDSTYDSNTEDGYESSRRGRSRKRRSGRV
jgi:hypothetical protein